MPIINEPFALPSPDDRDFWGWLQKAQRELPPLMRESAIYVGIAPEGEPDAKFCLELGMAIMYDKPLIILAIEGRTVPPGLRRIAQRVVEIDSLESEEGKNAMLAALSEAVERGGPPPSS